MTRRERKSESDHGGDHKGLGKQIVLHEKHPFSNGLWHLDRVGSARTEPLLRINDFGWL